MVDELLFVPRQEDNGMFGFNVFGMSLFVKNAQKFAAFGTVFAQLGVVLVAVYLDKVNTLFIGAPTDVGEIAVGRVACLQVDGLVVGGVVGWVVGWVVGFVVG